MSADNKKLSFVLLLIGLCISVPAALVSFGAGMSILASPRQSLTTLIFSLPLLVLGIYLLQQSDRISRVNK